MILQVTCLALLIVAANSYKILNDHEAMMYLNRFGYVNDEDVSDDDNMSMVKPMLMEFQKMCHIDTTGKLDSKTIEMMNAPRCGNLDINETTGHTMFLREMGDENEIEALRDRYKRFVLNDNSFRWKKRELTYKMGMFSNNMASHVTQEVALEQLHEAFKLWSEVTNLDFFHTPNDKRVDIEISFTMRFHKQDQFPFDGPGKTLAHAFPPGEGVLGDVHFEDEENWTVRTPSGINVLFVAVHEIGHALGLKHSMTRGSIMQPFYGGYSPKLQLHPDDVAGVQAMYGKREGRSTSQVTDATTTTPRPRTTTTTHTTTTTTRKPSTLPPRTHPPRGKVLGDTTGSTSERPDLCKDASIDAITTLRDGTVYAFKGNYAFAIDGKGRGVLPNNPNRIETIFRGLEGNLDAAVTRKNGKTYFFKGPYYWRFDGMTMDPGYPKKTSVHFRGIPDNIDSAFEWLGAIYFTKSGKIWRFDPKSKPFVSNKYPISLDLWHLGENVPRIDASFRAPSGIIYFFYQQTYWRFDQKKFQVNGDLSPPYPRSSKIYWFGCKGNAPVDYREIRQLLPYENELPLRGVYGDY